MVYKLEESLGKTLYGLYSSRDSKNKTVFARQLEEILNIMLRQFLYILNIKKKLELVSVCKCQN